MIRYKIKPVLIDAYKFTGLLSDRFKSSCPKWLKDATKLGEMQVGAFHHAYVPDESPGAAADARRLIYYIVSPQGPVEVEPGDYILKGAGNVIFPLPAETFEKAYERIECNPAGVPLTACVSNGAWL